MNAHTIFLINNNNNISIISTGFMCPRSLYVHLRTRDETRQQETGLQSTGTCLCVQKPKMSPHFIETHNAGATNHMCCYWSRRVQRLRLNTNCFDTTFNNSRVVYDSISFRSILHISCHLACNCVDIKLLREKCQQIFLL